MAKIGRNNRCSCGSGKKYKRCCLVREKHTPAVFESHPLDELSNAVVDRIREGKLDEAERLCKKLAEDYPDMIDPLDRYALLYEAKGEYARAAELYRQAAAFAQTSEGFDIEISEDFLSRARKLENSKRPGPTTSTDGEAADAT